MKNSRLDWKVLIFLYTLSIILLWEWFIPIVQLTDFGHAPLFMFYLLLFFSLALLNAKWWISAPIQLGYIIWTLHYMYFDQIFLSLATLGWIVEDFKQNVFYLLQGDIGDLSNLFRTILLFMLIWMLAYLIRYWIEVRNHMMTFFVITVLFVALLDTFSPYEASTSIVRIMMVGLLLIGYMALIRLAGEKRLHPNRLVMLSLPLLAVVLVVGLVAKTAPVQSPAWPDPVPFLLAMIGIDSQQRGNGVSKAGYDTDDSQLGGAFLQDHQLVFEVTVEERQYWRIETKDTYTSKGWIQELEDAEILRTNENFGAIDEQKPSYARLQFSEKLPFVVMPYGARKLLYPETLSIMHEIPANRFSLLMGEQEKITQYDVEYVTPSYTLSELQRAEMLAYETVSEDLTSYTQLPGNLPQRVVELALSITEKETTVYGKVKAVERYFKNNGFAYETQNVAVPTAEQDYVDQFLFDTKKGYCDNFSTSMAVMLRASGIPTRWVKGFAPGELAPKKSGDSVYRVTNDEAHSWVEAYIPEIGWMPFEPTIGFTHPTDITTDAGELMEEEPIVKQPNSPKIDKPLPPQRDKNSLSFIHTLTDKLFWFVGHWWSYAIFLALFVIGAILAYKRRGKWMPKWTIRKLRKQPDGWDKFERQYSELLRQLHRVGITKEAAMTLSSYAKVVDTQYGGERMDVLTRAYEKGLYGKDYTSQPWQKLHEVWEDLIIRTSC